MRRISVVFVVVLMMSWTLSVTRAQADLTQTYTDPDGTFTVMYPGNWSVFSSAIGSATLGGDDMQAQINYAGGSGMDTSFKDFVSAFTSAAPEPPVFTDVDLGDKKLEKAQAKINGMALELVGIDIGGKLSAVIIGFGSNASVDKLDPILVAIATSYQVGTGSGGSASSPVATQTTDSAQPTATTPATTGAAGLPAMVAVARPTVTGTAAIAFTSTDLDRPGIALIEPSGQNFSLLTHNKFTDWLPAFSPDGTMIAFVAEDSPNNADGWDVYVVDSKGGEPRKLSSKPSTNPAAVAWSPDSKQLIFIATRSDADGGAGIYKVNVDGSGEQKLSLDGMDSKLVTLDLLAWSNDGTRIAFVGVPPGANDWTFTFADADGTHLTAGPAFNIAQIGATFQWSPDGQHALYSDAASLEVTDADGNNPTVLVATSENLNLMGASWSPDGTQIAFAATDQTGAVASLYVMNADGSNRQKIDLGQHDLDALGVSWGVIAGASGQTAAPAQPTTAAAAPTPVVDTKLVTSTAGKYTVSVSLPTTPGVTVRDFARESAEIAVDGLSIIGFDVDVTFPPSVSGGTTAKTMLESKSNYAKGPITEFQVDGREAARLDAENQDNSEYVYMIVKTANGDYVDVEFTVLVDRKAEVEPAMLAVLASVTTGDPNAQPAAQPTTDGSAAPTIEAGGAAAPASCTVTANGTANLRGGPGTSFAKAGTLTSGQSQSVTGQATGSDGKVWYQLGSSYVRSDLVKADGDCASVPTVSP